MADYDTDEAPSQPTSPLDKFQGMFKTSTGQAMAREAAVRINDYANRKQIAESNMAAGQAFSDNLAEMRGNLIETVQADPAATDLALDLAHLGTKSMVGSVYNVDPAHIDTISTGIQQDIARQAVMSAADRHEGLARGLLDSPRISDLLGDEKDQLSGYITGQEAARRIDAQGAQKMQQQEALARTNQGAWQYMAALVDPDTGDLSHPPGWAQRVMGDQSLPPQYKATLFDAYGRLTEDGDVPVSNPSTVTDMIQGAASGAVHPIAPLNQIGVDLRAADAVYLSKLTSQPDRAAQLSDALDLGRDQLAAPENGPAGQRAYAGYVNWLLSAGRQGADLDPSSKGYALAGNRLQQFAPRASDNVEAAVQVPPQERRPLSDIFGGSRRV